ncbi:MAG: MFS transporter [Opitutales bacterium]
MIITRKKKIPLHWAFYAQLPLILTIYGNMVVNAPFLLLIKRFIDNPATIMGLISIEVYLTLFGGPFVSWLSDRIWTRFGRRKFFQASADGIRGVILLAMPLAPNLWVLIILRWIYGAFGDFGAPTQALAYEIVPAPQRGRSAGFMSAFMQLGNLVFFFLVLGRFDDVYFMGPFSYAVSGEGGVIMFWLAALLLLGTSMFEFLSIKEIYPVARQRLQSGRPLRRGVVAHFFISFFRDVLAKDLAPLYLLSFAFLMFGFALGFFQPLLFTEEWGYSLQEMGNTIAVGVILGLGISLLAGWLADRTSKMKVYLLATIGNLVVNIVYTIYVFYKPDNRPSLFEIVIFGNLAYIFGATRGVVGFPLLMEYVSRNRMGSAGAGLVLFNGIFRNGIGLLVGAWLALWSIWFLPQAGYHLEAIFDREKDEAAVVELLESGGIDLETYELEPLHQYGVDGETSKRWWIHRNEEKVKELLDEREDLTNEIAALKTEKESFFTDASELPGLDAQIEAKQARMKTIDETLDEGAQVLQKRIEPLLAGVRFQPGQQIRQAALEDGQLIFELTTIEGLHDNDVHDDPEKEAEARQQTRENLQSALQGPEHALVEGDEGKLVPDIEVAELPGEVPGIRLRLGLDNRFMSLFRAAHEAGLSGEEAYEVGAIVVPALRSVLGRQPNRFELREVRIEAASGDESVDAEKLRYPIEFLLVNQSGRPVEPEVIADLLKAEKLFGEASAFNEGMGIRVESELRIAAAEAAEDTPKGIEAETRMRLAQFLDAESAEFAYSAFAYPNTVETLAARPTYLTVPRHSLEASYGERVFKYFFPSQYLQIATDIIGLLILWMIVILEKRGTLHRYGAEEDQAR